MQDHILEKQLVKFLSSRQIIKAHQLNSAKKYGRHQFFTADFLWCSWNYFYLLGRLEQQLSRRTLDSEENIFLIKFASFWLYIQQD
jgi:hypothetical protein